MTNPKVDFFFEKDSKWKQEYETLRNIVLECGLSEELKWGEPCYTLQQANIVLIHGFKEYCALLFFKGALLNDSNGILIQQTENVQTPRNHSCRLRLQLLHSFALLAYIRLLIGLSLVDQILRFSYLKLEINKL